MPVKSSTYCLTYSNKVAGRHLVVSEPSSLVKNDCLLLDWRWKGLIREQCLRRHFWHAETDKKLRSMPRTLPRRFNRLCKLCSTESVLNYHSIINSHPKIPTGLAWPTRQIPFTPQDSWLARICIAHAEIPKLNRQRKANPFSTCAAPWNSVGSEDWRITNIELVVLPDQN